MNILIIGSTGQLGYTICKKLQNTGNNVFALHRTTSDISLLQKLNGIQRIEGDLTDVSTLKRAVEGKDVVISTANTAAPRLKADTFKKVDIKGHKKLLKACKESLVKQFIFTSVLPFGELNESIPLGRAKKTIEEAILATGIPYTIFQPAAFMDIHFGFYGTEIPIQGTEMATLNRPFKFMNNFYDGIRNDIAEKGRFHRIGKGNMPTSYISIEDVAEFHVRAIGNPHATNRIFQIGGPEALTPNDLKSIFEKIYSKKLKVKTTSPLLMKWMSKIFSLINRPAANIFALNYAGSQVPMVVKDAVKVADEFGIELIDAEQYLRNKMTS